MVHESQSPGLLIHMEALKSDIWADTGWLYQFYNGGRVDFFSRVQFFFFLTFICPKEYAGQILCWLMQRCVRYSWNKSVTDGKTEGRMDGGHSYSPPFCSANGGGQKCVICPVVENQKFTATDDEDGDDGRQGDFITELKKTYV